MRTKDTVDRDVLFSNLRTFLKHNGDIPEALEVLAKLSEEDGKIDESAQFMTRAAKAAGSPRLWHEVAKLWLRHDNPERALSAVRSACKESSGNEKIGVNVDLIRLYLSLQRAGDALALVEESMPMLDRELAASAAPGSNGHTKQKTGYEFLLTFLKGVCLERLGREAEAEAIWEKLGRYDSPMHLSLLGAEGKAI